MARRKNSSRPETAAANHKGLRAEAWIAIGTVTAAVITGIVTLIVHWSPQKPPSSSTLTVSSTPLAASPSRIPLVTADAIAGSWSGQAKDTNGKSFQIAISIRKSCALNEQCGSISVSHVPCYGEVFLESVSGDEFEFRVANFYGQSNRNICQPGAGEHFRLRPDGKLQYTTTYEPRAEGLLEKQA